MKELGIEHKTLASNTKLHEVVNDAFEDYNPEGAQSWIEKLEQTHKLFIQHVTKYRKVKNENAFKAEVYNGEEALKIGLIDELGIAD